MAINLVMTMPWRAVQFTKILHPPKTHGSGCATTSRVKARDNQSGDDKAAENPPPRLMEADALRRLEERHVANNLEITRMMKIFPPPRLVEVDALQCPEVRRVAINL